MKKIALAAVSTIALAAFPAAAQQVDTDPDAEAPVVLAEKSPSQPASEAISAEDAAIIDSKKAMAAEPAPAPAPDSADAELIGEKKSG